MASAQAVCGLNCSALAVRCSASSSAPRRQPLLLSTRALPRSSFAGCTAELQRSTATSPTSRRANLTVRAELKVGDKMKDYSDYYRVLKTSNGKTVALSNFEGKKPVVVFFYPKAATPGCTKQACKFRDEYARFQDAGVEVFGISGDSPEDNAAFAQAQRLPFPLLSDPNNLLRKAFGIKADMFGILPGRQTFVIDKDGKCIMSFNNQMDAEQHVTEALKALGL